MDSVSIIIPCRNEKSNIEEAISRLIECDLVGISLEILVIDGRSDDGTLEVLDRIKQKIPFLRVLDNPNQTTPFAFNLGIGESKGDYIQIVGARHILSKNYIQKGLDILKNDSEIVGVGGVVENLSETENAEVIARAMKSPFGVGMGNFRAAANSGFVGTVGTPLYRKSIFEEVGLFNEALTRNQDDEFNYRIIKSGGKLWLEKSMCISYYVRPSFKKLYRQYWQYGYWKVYVNKLHNSITSLRQVVPAVFTFFLFSLPVFWLLDIIPFYLFFLALYLILALYFGIRSADSASQAVKILYCFILLHISYGAGYLRGIWDFLLMRRTPVKKSIKLTR